MANNKLLLCVCAFFNLNRGFPALNLVKFGHQRKLRHDCLNLRKVRTSKLPLKLRLGLIYVTVKRTRRHLSCNNKQNRYYFGWFECISTNCNNAAISVNEIVSVLHGRKNFGSVPTAVNTASYYILVTFS